MTQIAASRASRGMPVLPDVADFPTHPPTWHLFGRSAELNRGPVSKTVSRRRLVAYRAETGKVAVLNANCAHLGADLGRGRVVGDAIQCPFHHWKYDPTGRCVSTPLCGASPDAARLQSYPARERHGYVFFFSAPAPLFPLPFFAGCDPDEFVASSPFRFEMDCPWYMLVANGFDAQHFQAVHDRRLKNTPQVDCPARFARRMCFQAEVTGSSIFDRLLRRFVGEDVAVSITSWGGPYVLVEGEFGRAHSRLLVASQSLDEHHTLSDVIVFAKRSRLPLVAPVAERLSLRIRRRFTRAFMQYDIDKLSGVRYQPSGLTEQDREMIEFFQWLTELPRSEYEASPP